MAYPTATEMLLYRNRVRRRDAFACQNRAAEHREHAFRSDVEPELRQRSKTLFFEAMELSERYAFEARIHGFKLPG